MENLYRILNLEPTASAEEMKKAINRERRLWSNRTNAPQLERRQEAERMIQLLQEAETILLNVNTRADYDRQLATQPAGQQLTNISESDPQDLIAEGRRLLSMGNIADALYVATVAKDQDFDNSEAWALLGQAHFLWGNIYDAISDYGMAIRLQPNIALYYFELGNIYESMEQGIDALQQYQRAIQIDPQTTMYRAAAGGVLITLNFYQDSITILQQCVQEEPENSTYQRFLALAYASSSYQHWTYIPEGSTISSGYYATRKEQIQEALVCVEKAESFKFEDPDLSVTIMQIKSTLQSMLNRKFYGNRLAVGTAIGLGVILLLFNWGLALYFLICSGLYIASCMTPQYILNRKAIGGKDVATTYRILAFLSKENDEPGCLSIIMFAIIILFLPIMAAANFLMNYALAS